MNKICKLLLFLSIFITLGDALKCYSCSEKPKPSTTNGTDARAMKPSAPCLLTHCFCQKDEQGELVDCPKELEDPVCYVAMKKNFF